MIESKIISEACTMLKSPNKKDCFEIIGEVVKRIEGGTHPDDPIITDTEAAKLYAFFLPPLPAKPKTAFQWAAKAIAISKQERREPLKFLHSDGKRLAASDGNRLHVLNKTDLPEGYYNRNGDKIKLSSDLEFPDIDGFLCVEGDTFWMELKDFHKSESRMLEHAKTPTPVLKIGANWFDRKLVVDAISYFNDTEKVECYDTGRLSSLSLKQGDLTAVIMPMNIGHE